MLDNPESFKVHAQNYVHAANVVLFFDCSQHFARKENVTEIKVMMLFKNEMDSFFYSSSKCCKQEEKNLNLMIIGSAQCLFVFKITASILGILVQF